MFIGPAESGKFHLQLSLKLQVPVQVMEYITTQRAAIFFCGGSNALGFFNRAANQQCASF